MLGRPGQPSHAPAVEVQSWLNAHRANLPGEDSLSVHTHHFSWHGYLLLDAAGTNTTYHAPPPEPYAQHLQRSTELLLQQQQRRQERSQLLEESAAIQPDAGWLGWFGFGGGY